MLDEDIKAEAEAWARKNKKTFAKALTDTKRFPGELSPVSVFMAGSPGAGKTETAKALVKQLGDGFLHIDPDDFRAAIPGYNGSNSWLFQGAVSILLGRVLDLAFDQKQSFLLDGTLSNLAQAERNIERSLAKKRQVLILYVYQQPQQAWKFVVAREAMEGRRIPRDRFVEQFLGAHSVVNSLKARFGSDVTIDAMVKDIEGHSRRYHANVSDLNDAVPIAYSLEQLYEIVDSQ